MAVQQKPSLSWRLNDRQKVYVMVALAVMLVGVWVVQWNKSSASGASAKRAPKKSPATETASADAASSPAPAATSSTASPGLAEPATPAVAANAVPIKALNKLLPMLSRNPFSVSKAMARLTRKIAAAEEGGASGNGEAQGHDAGAHVQAMPKLMLQATVIDGPYRYGLINGQIVVEGQTYQGMKVSAVREREVILDGPGGPVRLIME